MLATAVSLLCDKIDVLRYLHSALNRAMTRLEDRCSDRCLSHGAPWLAVVAVATQPAQARRRPAPLIRCSLDWGLRVNTITPNLRQSGPRRFVLQMALCTRRCLGVRVNTLGSRTPPAHLHSLMWTGVRYHGGCTGVECGFRRGSRAVPGRVLIGGLTERVGKVGVELRGWLRSDRSREKKRGCRSLSSFSRGRWFGWQLAVWSGSVS
jgi:hypothetical protein